MPSSAVSKKKFPKSDSSIPAKRLTIEVDNEAGVVSSGSAELSTLYFNVTSRLEERSWGRGRPAGSTIVRDTLNDRDTSSEGHTLDLRRG